MFQMPEALEKGNLFIASLPLSELYFKDEKRFPWFILVPRRSVEELFLLPPHERYMLMDEISQVQSILQSTFQISKMNVGALGNKVRALHVHVIGRTEDDPFWPEGIWQAGYFPVNYEKKERDAIILHLQGLIKEAMR